MNMDGNFDVAVISSDPYTLDYRARIDNSEGQTGQMKCLF